MTEEDRAFHNEIEGAISRRVNDVHIQLDKMEEMMVRMDAKRFKRIEIALWAIVVLLIFVADKMPG